MDPESGKLKFELVTPSAVLASEEVDMVVVPGTEGDLGVLLGHSALLSSLRPGLVDVHQSGKVTKSIFIEGGFADVTGEICTVVASKATDIEELQPEFCDQRLSNAIEQLEADAETGDNNLKRELEIAEAMVFSQKNGKNRPVA